MCSFSKYVIFLKYHQIRLLLLQVARNRQSPHDLGRCRLSNTACAQWESAMSESSCWLVPQETCTVYGTLAAWRSGIENLSPCRPFHSAPNCQVHARTYKHTHTIVQDALHTKQYVCVGLHSLWSFYSGWDQLLMPYLLCGCSFCSLGFFWTVHIKI